MHAVGLFQLVACGLIFIFTAAPAQAAVSVFGSSLPALCYERAESGSTISRDCDNALDDFEMTLQDRASTLVNRGVVYNNARKFELALADFQAALAIDSEIPEAYLNRGNSRFLQGRFQDAIADYTRAIDLNIERMSAARYDRALAYGQIGDFRSAQADLQVAVALAPDFKEARDHLALLDRILAQSAAPPPPSAAQPQ